MSTILAVVVLAQATLVAWLVRRAPADAARNAQERKTLLALLAEQARDAAEERRALADRIQHPERIQVPPAPDYQPFDPPPDQAEIAHVGQIVPEFVHVGTPLPPDAKPPEEVYP